MYARNRRLSSRPKGACQATRMVASFGACELDCGAPGCLDAAPLISPPVAAVGGVCMESDLGGQGTKALVICLSIYSLNPATQTLGSRESVLSDGFHG